ncbi:MAG: DUF2971 domain-containing protein, partial [Alphaproteobacteria bacterium]
SQFLNDPDEVRHGFTHNSRVIVRYLQELIKTKLPNSELSSFLLSFLKKIVEDLIDNMNASFFIVSFCSSGDLLSQWRSYFKNGLGISIGFDYKYLKDICLQHNLIISNVLYNDKDKEATISKIITAAIEIAGSNQEVLNEPIYKDLFSKIIILLSLFYKDVFFKEEDECRIVQESFNPEDGIFYRNGFNKLIPYIKLPLSANLNEIKTIIAGPMIDSDKLERSIKLKYPHIHIQPSDGKLQ